MLDIQGGSLTWLAVDAGCGLGAQLKLVTTGKHVTSPCGWSFSEHAFRFQETGSQEQAFQETLGDRQRFLTNLENHTASLLLCYTC